VTIIFEPLLNTFEASDFFEAVWAEVASISSLKPNHHCQVVAFPKRSVLLTYCHSRLFLTLILMRNIDDFKRHINPIGLFSKTLSFNSK